MEKPLFFPILPLSLKNNDFVPIATLLVPSKRLVAVYPLNNRAESPIATSPLRVTFSLRAAWPMATFELPVVLKKPAS